jgi:hypothetical protein
VKERAGTDVLLYERRTTGREIACESREEATMTASTPLEPLSADCARELLNLLERAGEDDATALALDADGRVLGVVGAEDCRAEHLPGDLAV